MSGLYESWALAHRSYQQERSLRGPQPSQQQSGGGGGGGGGAADDDPAEAEAEAAAGEA